MPKGDLFNISFFKKDGYLGLLYIEFITYPGVFYPVTETVKLYLNNDRSYKLESTVSKDISLKEIDRIVTDVTSV
jgi:hypothetical protein